jgi:hypothetical protein
MDSFPSFLTMEKAHRAEKAPVTIKVEKGASTLEVGGIVIDMTVDNAKEAPAVSSAARSEKKAPILSKVKVEQEASSIKVIHRKDE